MIESKARNSHQKQFHKKKISQLPTATEWLIYEILSRSWTLMPRIIFCHHLIIFSHLASSADPYHAYRNLETNSLHDSNNINQNFSSQPYFDFSVARNVTTRVGQTAFLSCRVEQLGDKLVRIFLFHSSYDEDRIMSSAIFFNLAELFRLSIGCYKHEMGKIILRFFFRCRYRGYEKEIFIY